MEKLRHISIPSEAVLGLSLIFIAGFCSNLGDMFTVILPCSDKELANLALLTVFEILGFIVLPIIVMQQLCGENGSALLRKSIRLKWAVPLFIAIGTLGLFITSPMRVLQPLVVATGEEVLFRFVIWHLLRRRLSKRSSIIVGSLLFAVVLHLNGGFFFNLFTKFPMSVLLYWLSNKYGLQHSIALHWLNNLLVNTFL